VEAAGEESEELNLALKDQQTESLKG
jgi:hypothetical protein